MFKNLIFDWSGTLVDDLALTLDATNYVFEQYGRDSIDTEQFRSEFQLPYPDYYSRVLPEADLDELENHFRKAFDQSIVEVNVLKHAKGFLDFCKARGIRCFILTSVDAKAFDIQCKELGLYDYFEAIHSGIRHKDQHIHQLLAEHGLLAHETAFIGDMQHDVETAHYAGITSIAVLTGYNNAAQLSHVSPDMIIPDLYVLRNLMRRYPLPADHLNQIRINRLEIHTHIGVPDEERVEIQTLKADITLDMEQSFEVMNDDFNQTVCYDTLATRLQEAALSHPRLMIETLVNDLADVCLQEAPVRAVRIELFKYILPHTESVSVVIHKKK